ncbi:phage tail tube protein [Actinopolyspora halophila]|uniref:phage tail tube protein n=1 Tax=Actinopolyspora halophila TaxID=1850 RepID=UPI0003653F63|nr:phage tail tube protein [Actinopolyspora halophila]
MATGSGISAQLGIAEEVTYGQFQAPDRFYEFVSEELSQEIERVESESLRSGTFMLSSSRWSDGKKNVEGDIELELTRKNQGLLFKHMLGQVATAQPDDVGAPSVYTHTFTPGDFPTGLTVQVGRTAVNGTTHAFSYLGCRVSEWELSAAVEDPVSLTLSLFGRDETTAESLVPVVYPAANRIYTFVHGSLTVDGTPVDVKEFSLSGENGLDDERYFLGSQLRKAPIQAELRTYEGEITTEFNDLTLYNKFVQGQEAALELTFDSGVNIESSYNFQIKITCNVRFDGETPTVDGTEIIEQSLAFTCIDDGSGPGSAVTVELTTDETTP